MQMFFVLCPERKKMDHGFTIFGNITLSRIKQFGNVSLENCGATCMKQIKSQDINGSNYNVKFFSIIFKKSEELESPMEFRVMLEQYATKMAKKGTFFQSIK